MLGISLSVGEGCSIGDSLIVLDRASPRLAKLGIEAPRELTICRHTYLPPHLARRVRELCPPKAVATLEQNAATAAGNLRRVLELGLLGGVEDEAHMVLAYLERLSDQPKIAG